MGAGDATSLVALTRHSSPRSENVGRHQMVDVLPAISKLTETVFELEAWRHKADRVIRHFTSSGDAVNIDTDVVVKDANLLVFTSKPVTGKGNLVVGLQHQYSLASNGFVAGFTNLIQGDGNSVTGGASNSATGTFASVAGGVSNTACGLASSVTGGTQNTASGNWSSVSGGDSNNATGPSAAVAGGFSNKA